MKNFVIAFHVCCETKEQAHQWRMSALQILDQNTHALGYKPDETGDLNCHCSGHADEENGEEEIPLIPAPVVSTAAPEPPQIKVQRYDPIAEIQEIANNLAKSGDCIGSLKLEAAINALAPESYKPAEEVMPTATEDDNRSHIRRSAKEASLKTPGLAATPVTVEAPEKFHKTAIKILEWLEINKPDARFYQYSSDHVVKTVASIIEVAATPKPIGDVEAVNEAIKDAIEELCRHICVRMPKNSVLPIKFSEAETIMRSHLSPFFAPAGPEISSDEIRHLVDCVHIGLNGSVSAHEGFGNSSCIACIVGLKLAANGTSPAQPPCSECATLQDKLEIAQRYGQREYAIEQILRGDLSTAVAECATLRKERDDARKSLESELHYTNCDKLHRERETKRHWQERAEAAEAQLSTQLQAFKDAQDSLNDALSHLRHSSNENAIIYVKEGLTFISAALAPTPEVAPKE